MADTLDSGSSAARHGGSTPLGCTNFEAAVRSNRAAASFLSARERAAGAAARSESSPHRSGASARAGRYLIWPAFAIERASTDWISAKPCDETGLRPFCASSIEAFSSK